MLQLWTKACAAEDILALPILTQWADEKRLQCLYILSNHVEEHYHSVTIAKKSGGRRNLLVPDPLLKQVQREILQNMLALQPISVYATAYHKGATIRANGAAHLGQGQILKLDIQNFFPSILYPAVLASCFSSKQYSPAAGALLANLCCYKGYLPQGAPTSPAISNLVLRSFDDWVGAWCEKQGIIYTRYCDDLIFSGLFDASAVGERVSRYLQAMGFTLNDKKTRLLRRHQRQLVTGVVVNEKVQAPRQYRRKLRQELYYCERYGVAEHLLRSGQCTAPPQAEEIGRYLRSLLGKVQFVLQINPEDKEFQQASVEVKSWLAACNQPL